MTNPSRLLRRPLNPALDPRPAIVVQPAGVGDVQAAVIAAREGDLPIAVQATGHGLHRSYDGGLLLNTSAMRAVSVDPHRRIARAAPPRSAPPCRAASSRGRTS